MDEDFADVRVEHELPVVTAPPDSGPDPSIRPWPADGTWISPDLTITNPMATTFGWPQPTIQGGATNTLTATVSNNTNQPASNVIVGFWVKDFTVSEAAPEQLLGYVKQDVPAQKATAFALPWDVPDIKRTWIGALLAAFLPTLTLPQPTHLCLVARILPLQDASGKLLERTVDNNVAQTNVTWAFASIASPTSAPAFRSVLPIHSMTGQLPQISR